MPGLTYTNRLCLAKMCSLCRTDKQVVFLPFNPALHSAQLACPAPIALMDIACSSGANNRDDGAGGVMGSACVVDD